MSASLIIPAAGTGARFGAALPKQLHLLSGRAVLLRSIDRFAGLVDEVVIAVADDMRSTIEPLLKQAEVKAPIKLVRGGTSRMESVANALRATNPSNVHILVHDAVRPLVSQTVIKNCLLRLQTTVAVLAAIPCTDTLKRARGDNLAMVQETVPRVGLWLAQTPQGFHRHIGLAAFEQAVSERWQCSDDAQVLEKAGHPVALVTGETRNLKITVAEDLALAEALLKTSR